MDSLRRMTSIVRRGGVAVLAGMAALAAAGCSVTSYSSQCSGGTCTVTLTGAGASTDLGSGGSTITLVSVDSGVATFELAGEDARCSAGETVEVAELTVECTKIGDDSVELIVNE